MAQPEFMAQTPIRVVAPKPRMTIYYALLIIALVCMITACIIMYMEIRRFGGFGTVPQRISAVERSSFIVCHGVTEVTEGSTKAMHFRPIA